MRRTLAMLGASVVLILGGCTADRPAEGSRAPAPVPVRSAGPENRAAGETDLLNLYDRVHEAAERLVRRCMEEEGFDLHPAMRGSPLSVQGGYPFRDPLDPVSVAEVGYGLGRTLEDPVDEANEPPDDPFDRQPEEAVRAYLAAAATMGAITLDDGTALRVPVAGCRFRIYGSLFGDIGSYATATNYLMDRPNRVLEATRSDPRVVGVTSAWSQCMAEKGFAGLGDPDETLDVAMRLYGERGTVPGYSPAAERREIDLATVDVECSVRHDLDRTLREVWTEQLSTYGAEEEARLAALRELLETAAAEAQRLVQDG